MNLKVEAEELLKSKLNYLMMVGKRLVSMKSVECVDNIDNIDNIALLEMISWDGLVLAWESSWLNDDGLRESLRLYFISLLIEPEHMARDLVRLNSAIRRHNLLLSFNSVGAVS
jgi:hypothetical protein